MRGLRGHNGKPNRLVLVTPKGLLREVPVDREQLLALAEDAIAIVRFMDRKGS